ncbi:MAG: DMT family transporter [bacterium]
MPGNVAILILGVFACSTAVIMIRLSELNPILLSSYRLLVAAMLLLPLFLRDYRASGGKQSLWSLFTRALVPGLFLGAHFIFWIVGARKTPSTNSSLVVNMVPVVMPFCLYLLSRERLNRWEYAGTALSVAGLAVLAGTDLNLSADYFAGDAFCLVSMLLLAVYLALARRNSSGSTLWLYLVPVYLIGGLFCLACGFAFAGPLDGISGSDALYVLGLAAVPTVVGHTSMNYCMRKMRGQAVAIAGLGQFVFAGILAYFILKEIPSIMFYPASVLVVVGSVIAIRFGPKTVQADSL